jgi:hypothetical protein
MSSEDEEPEVRFTAATGELYSLDKKERILLREIIRLSLATASGRKKIRKRFGKVGFEVAESLLAQMGTKVEGPFDTF